MTVTAIGGLIAARGGAIDAPIVWSETFDDPDALTSALETLAVPQFGNWERYTNIVTADASEAWRAKDLVEASQLIYDPDDTDASRRYKLYGPGEAADGTPNLSVWFSPDGETWTGYSGNPLGLNVDDLQWLKIGSTVHAYVESPGEPGQPSDIRRYTITSSGTVFTDQGLAVARGGPGANDEERCGSPRAITNLAGLHVMVYDARSAAEGAFQKLHAATSVDGIAWTKVAGNPVLTVGSSGHVPAEMWQDEDGVYWVVMSAGGDNAAAYLYRCENPDPTSWIDGDWVNVLGSGSAFRAEGGPRLVQNSGRKTWLVGERNQVTPADNLIRKVDALGTDRITFQRWQATGADARERLSLIEAHDGVLKLDPNTPPTTAFSLLMRIDDLDLASGFAVMWRMKKEIKTTADLFTRVSIGSGVTVSASSFAQWATFTEGYSILHGTNAGTETLQSITAGTAATLATGTGPADFTGYHDFELRYTSDGHLSYLIDGVQVIAPTLDTTHLAAAKQVMVTQGQHTSSGGRGARSFFERLVVRRL